MTEGVILINTGVEMRSVSGSTQQAIVEIPRAEWDAMTPEQREKRLEEIAQVTLVNEVDAWAYVEDGED